MPATSLHALPDAVDAVLGALVEPGGNALRAARAAALRPGDRALVLGPGRSGCWRRCSPAPPGPRCTCWAARTVAGFARSLGFEHVWTEDILPELPFDAVVDASNAPHLPAGRWTWSSRPAGSSTSDWPAARAASTPARSRSRTSPRSGSCPPPRSGRHHPGVRRPPVDPRRSSRPPSGSTRSAPCWPASAPRPRVPAQIHVDPRLGCREARLERLQRRPERVRPRRVHRVLDLILAKDGDGAERVMREHVRRSHQALMAGMDERWQRSRGSVGSGVKNAGVPSSLNGHRGPAVACRLWSNDRLAFWTVPRCALDRSGSRQEAGMYGSGEELLERTPHVLRADRRCRSGSRAALTRPMAPSRRVP